MYIMLHFSFSTILMAMLTSSVLVGLIGFVFFHKKTMVCAGYKLLAVFAGLAIVRMFIPFEFSFTSDIYFSPVISKFIVFLRNPQVPVLNTKLSIWNFCEAIWIIGIIFNVVRFVREYCRTQDYILKYGQEHTEDIKYKTILDNICILHNKKNNFHVMELPNISVPIIFGLRKPYIMLPAEVLIPTDKLYYVLYHEAMHHFYHDFLIKGIIRIFSIIYWWNPLFIVLYRQADTILEMRVDKAITHNEAEITNDYAECLLYMKKNSAKYSSKSSDFLKQNSCYFILSHDDDFKRRMYMLLQDYSVFKKIITGILLTVIIAGVYVLSYLIVLEADYCPPQFEETLLVPNFENTYFIKTGDSSYDVYLDGIYLETIDSLDSYPDGIKIYNEKGDLINEN